jgi:hypothetical protein
MTIRDRIVAALTWGQPDRVPLTLYDWILPRGATERRLRDLGVTEDSPVEALERSLETIAGVLEEYGAPA